MDNSKLLWIPRILVILFAVFISLFALDTFDGDAPFLLQLSGFLVHMIPSFVLAVVLIIFWKRCIIGGTIFIVIGVIFTLFFNTYKRVINFFALSFPLFLIGVLFILFTIIERNKNKQYKAYDSTSNQ